MCAVTRRRRNSATVSSRSASGSPGPARAGAEPTRRPAASPPVAPPPRPRRRSPRSGGSLYDPGGGRQRRAQLPRQVRRFSGRRTQDRHAPEDRGSRGRPSSSPADAPGTRSPAACCRPPSAWSDLPASAGEHAENPRSSAPRWPAERAVSGDACAVVGYLWQTRRPPPRELGPDAAQVIGRRGRRPRTAPVNRCG